MDIDFERYIYFISDFAGNYGNRIFKASLQPEDTEGSSSSSGEGDKSYGLEPILPLQCNAMQCNAMQCNSKLSVKKVPGEQKKKTKQEEVDTEVHSCIADLK